MNGAPLTRSQLIGLPFWAGLLGAGMAGFYLPWLGAAAAWVLAALLGGAMALLAGWIVWRGDFAARHGLAGAALMLLLLVPLLAGAGVMTVSMAGAHGLAPLVVWCSVASLAIAFVASARRQLQALQREGVDGAWARTNVDPQAARLRATALQHGGGDASTASPWTPWLVAALAANAPLVWRAWGASDAQAMPLVLLLLAGASVWVCAGFVGPLAGKALFVRELERHHGQRFVHEHHEDLQALRRGFWLSRWAMGAERAQPHPAATSQRR